jgi:chemotaxis protein methyltransferase CheR
MFMMKEIDLADIKRITELIKSRYNYDFTNYALSSFKRRVIRILELEKMSLETLILNLEKKEFIQYFLNEITVNVTEMFRDPSFWRILRETIIPQILLNHQKIRIWHAGCSSGEEVFSMAILLKEMKIDKDVQLIATDLDTNILDRAKKARLPMKNMELNERNYIRFQGTGSLTDYYKIDNNEAVLHPSLLENVSFRQHDLVRGDVFNKFDLVLCRNVMIYFNQQLQNDVLNKLHESLFKYGYLAIGSKESLIWCDIASKFLVVNNEEKIYRKIKD